MREIDQKRIEESLFVFLHGPKAFESGVWEPILLDLLCYVGFGAVSVDFEQKLTLHHPVVGGIPGTIGESYTIPQVIPFGVCVRSKNIGSEKTYWDNDAIQWLNQLALQIRSSRTGRIILDRKDKLPRTTPDLEAMVEDENRKRAEILAHDPQTFADYVKGLDGLMALQLGRTPDSGIVTNLEFNEFFDEALPKLRERIEASKSLEPIVISEFGERFIQSDSPGLHGKNLSDEMELMPGLHETCSGNITFWPISATTLVMKCDTCLMREKLSRTTILTLGHLRNRGERFQNR